MELLVHRTELRPGKLAENRSFREKKAPDELFKAAVGNPTLLEVIGE